jgi:hypothetical protein
LRQSRREALPGDATESGRRKEHDVPITDNNTPPESPAARYRRRAEELRAMATGAQSVSVKDEFLALAQQYEKLADESRIMDRWR